MDVVFAALVTLVVALAVFNGLGTMRLSIARRRAREAELSLARAQLRINAMAATIERQAAELRSADRARDVEAATHKALMDAAIQTVDTLEAEIGRLRFAPKPEIAHRRFDL